MSFFARITAFFRTAFTRKRKEQEWAARFDTPPEKHSKLPLDPRNPGGLA